MGNKPLTNFEVRSPGRLPGSRGQRYEFQRARREGDHRREAFLSERIFQARPEQDQETPQVYHHFRVSDSGHKSPMVCLSVHLGQTRSEKKLQAEKEQKGHKKAVCWRIRGQLYHTE